MAKQKLTQKKKEQIAEHNKRSTERLIKDEVFSDIPISYAHILIIQIVQDFPPDIVICRPECDLGKDRLIVELSGRSDTFAAIGKDYDKLLQNRRICYRIDRMFANPTIRILQCDLL